MSTQEVAKSFTELCRQGKFTEAGQRYWADDCVSLEPIPGDMSRLKGAKALEQKGKEWAAHNKVNAMKVEGPFVNGDEFALRFEFDITPEGKERTKMSEVALYTVKNDKVIEERFFY